ncbi:hypothetical protein K8I61_20505 [bacterium]|nr:hypothetical protein [bacterium]
MIASRADAAHSEAGVDLITGPVADVTTIHRKKNTTAPYTGNVTMRGITCTGENAEVNVQPEDWNETNDDDANGPFNPTDGAGTWNPREAHTNDLRLDLVIEDSASVEAG